MIWNSYVITTLVIWTQLCENCAIATVLEGSRPDIIYMFMGVGSPHIHLDSQPYGSNFPSIFSSH